MASSHQVGIAKASFAAALLRQDPASVSRDEISLFHTSLDNVVVKCTPRNVQNCKDWLATNVLPSSGRITALGKYLVALSASFEKPTASNQAGRNVPLPMSKPSLKRKRLHLVYLINDVLHHAKYHSESASSVAILSSKLEPQIVEIISLAAAFEQKGNTKHHEKLNEILNIWQKQGYFSPPILASLRDSSRNASPSKGIEPIDEAVAQSTTAPYMLPASHGDANTPWHDLPAATMLPHIVPNSRAPIRPSLMKPLQFVAGPARSVLVEAVQGLLKEVENMYDESKHAMDEGIVMDVDMMGQSLVKHEETGKPVPLEAYYGWSIEFCDKMKRKKRGELDQDERGMRGRGRSRSRSSSQHSISRKRRRYSESRSRSRSPNRGRDEREESYSPPPVLSTQPKMTMPPFNRHLSGIVGSSGLPLATPVDQIDNPMTTVQPAAPSHGTVTSYQHNFQVGPGGLPIPPPPPFHTGPWPPPPPPSMSANSSGPHLPNNVNQHNFQHPQQSSYPAGNSWLPPPPPPPQQGGDPWPQQQQQGQYGGAYHQQSNANNMRGGGAYRGRGGNGWRGAGNWRG